MSKKRRSTPPPTRSTPPTTPTRQERNNDWVDRPAPGLEVVAGDLRQVLEGTTPGPWVWHEDGASMWLVGFDDADVLHGDEDRWVHMTQADGELIAAAPELLRRSLERIEQLEAAIADLGKQASRCFNTDGECMSCFAPAHSGSFGGNGRHEPGCIVAAAINVAKDGA